MAIYLEAQQSSSGTRLFLTAAKGHTNPHMPSLTKNYLQKKAKLGPDMGGRTRHVPKIRPLNGSDDLVVLAIFQNEIITPMPQENNVKAGHRDLFTSNTSVHHGGTGGVI
ncbi:hypothetical protein ElyMa_001915200 [Elysia marginata]|uniref:Uncharacterized protein n=1 Tax=Elysia marginata TaxID=1093978 RepID=A0AAV4EUC0_9GAST|nr:hypothetical protein ElyMa_001915200 [Elysia marginata]